MLVRRSDRAKGEQPEPLVLFFLACLFAWGLHREFSAEVLKPLAGQPLQPPRLREQRAP